MTDTDTSFDPLDHLFEDDPFINQRVTTVDAIRPEDIQNLMEHQQGSDQPLVVDMSSESTAIDDPEEILIKAQPLIDEYKESVKTMLGKLAPKGMARRKEILLQLYEMGLPLDDFPFNSKHARNALERQWSVADPKFAAHIQVARIKHGAITARRKQLSAFFDNESDRRELRSYKLGAIVYYDRTVASIVCDMIAEGSTLISVVKELGVPMNVIQRWRREVPEFAEGYQMAREASAEIRFDEVFGIADNADDTTRGGAQKARVQTDVRMKYASTMNKRTFGNKVDVQVTSTVDHTVTLLDARRTLEKKRKALMKEVNGEVVEVIPAPNG